MSRYYDSEDEDYKDERDELESDGDDGDDEKERIADASRSNTLVGELEEPRPANYSGQTLYRMMMENDIDLDPDYQRAVVWTEAAQSKIIESWMKRFHVPEILFRVIKHPDGEKRICIDGKQRLTSLRKFFDGEIPYIDEKTGKRYYYKFRPEHMARRVKPLELSLALRKRMENKQIRCEEYKDITESQERMLFERVQRGMALTPAEKLRSHNSPWSKYLNTVLQDQIHETSLSELISFNPARNAEFLALVRLAFIMVHDSDLSRPPSDVALSKWLSNRSRPTDHFKEHLQRTMDVFNEIAKSNVFRARAFCSSKELKQPPGITTKGSKFKFSPVEWVLTASLIAGHSDLQHRDLAEAIRGFREELNIHHYGEKRFNTKVMDRFRAWESNYFRLEPSQSQRKRKRTRGEDGNDEMNELFEERDSSPLPSQTATIKEVKKQDKTVRKFASKLRSSGASVPVPTPAKKHRANGEGSLLESTPSAYIGQAMEWMTMDASPAQLIKANEVNFGQPNDLLMK